MCVCVMSGEVEITLSLYHCLCLSLSLVLLSDTIRGAIQERQLAYGSKVIQAGQPAKSIFVVVKGLRSCRE